MLFGLALVCLAAVTWGTTGSVMALLAREGAPSPLVVGWARMAGAAALLLPAAAPPPPPEPRPRAGASHGAARRSLASARCRQGGHARDRHGRVPALLLLGGAANRGGADRAPCHLLGAHHDHRGRRPRAQRAPVALHPHDAVA